MSSLKRFREGLVRLAGAALVVATALLSAGMALATDGPRDNDPNSLIWGGCYTKQECVNKINHGDGHHSAANLQQIYYHEGRGITEANFMSADTVENGVVFKDGHVEVGGTTVATNALSSGRTPMPGSHPSGSVWERPPSVSFVANSIPAFVNMEGGVFHYAIIKSCANTVRATPVPKPTPTPTKSPSPTPTPGTFECVGLTPSQPDKDHQPRLFRFTAEKPNTTGGVQVTGYRFSFSDNSPVVDRNVNMPFVERTVKTSSLTVHLQVKTTAGITAITEACSATVTLTASTTPPTTPSSLTSPSPSGQVLGVTLPATGPEVALGGAAGLTAIGVASRAYLRSRKNLLDALRGKRSDAR